MSAVRCARDDLCWSWRLIAAAAAATVALLATGGTSLASASSPSVEPDGQPPGTTRVVSVRPDGTPAGFSYGPSISGNGRYVAFWSYSTELLEGEDISRRDNQAYLRDRKTGTTQLVSRDRHGGVGKDNSYPTSVSADGGVVVFNSLAGDLVRRDNNLRYDVFLRNIAAGTTRLISRSLAGASGNLPSHGGDVSADGGLVVFESEASNLVEDDTNGTQDVFAYDSATETTTLVSRDPAGTPANGISFDADISADGNFVVFASYATDLVADDTNDSTDIFLHDIRAGTTTMLSRTPDGEPANDMSHSPSISGAGEMVAYSSTATDLLAGPQDAEGDADVFVVDTADSKTRLVSHAVDGGYSDGDSDSYTGEVSADGRTVVFDSEAGDIIEGWKARLTVYAYDTVSRENVLISRRPDGRPLAPSESPVVSADGMLVAYQAKVTNDDGGFKRQSDAYVYRLPE